MIRWRVVLMLTLVCCGHVWAGDTTKLSTWRFAFAGDDTSADFARRADSLGLFRTVSVPHFFGAAGKSGGHQRGVGWYRKKLPIPDGIRSNQRVLLSFEGVSLRSTVFVDGRRAGANAFAYLPFEVDITPLVRPGQKCTVDIMVDNRLRDRDFPDRNCKGWWIYGGLIREVYLLRVPARRITDVSLRTFHHHADTFDLSVSYETSDLSVDSMVVEVYPESGSAVLRRAMQSAAGTYRIAGLRPWTPESPFRYTIRLTAWHKRSKVAMWLRRRGFCQLSARGTRLYLNGKPYFLKGAGRHDVLGNRGPLLTREQRRADLLDFKEMNANFVRIAHFPQHRDVYELCDSLGLLVMDEIPAWKTDARFLGSVAGRERGAAFMRALAKKHGNYTSVCLWSVGNEFRSYKNSIADYVEYVANATRRADPSRLITYCSYYYTFDKALSHLDVVSINEYFGWHLASLGLLAGMLDKINRQWPRKPVLISEFGAQSEKGKRNPSARLAGVLQSMVTSDLSEDHQALFLSSHLDTILARREYVGGVVVWAYNDFMARSRRPRTKEMPDGLNACGLVTRTRLRKLSYETVAQRYKALEKEQ